MQQNAYNKMNNKEIGKIIKQRRKYLKITQKELAEIISVGLRSLIKIENGEGNPTLDQLQKIIEALGLKLEIKIK